MCDKLTFDEILKLVNDERISTNKKNKTLFNNTGAIQYLTEKYPMINIIWDNRYEVLYLIKNDLDSPPICKLEDCSEYVKFTTTSFYGLFCSNTCSRKYANADKNIVEKRKRTMIDRYGVEYTLQSDEIKNKVKKTNLDRYGVEYAFQSDEVKEKIKKTNLDRYGAFSPTQNKDIHDKIKKTNIERYGEENPFKSDIIKEKIKQTNIERYGVENPLQCSEIREKLKKTMIDRYDVEYTFQSEEVQEKIKQTNIDRYGTEYPIRSHFNSKYIDIFDVKNLHVFKELLYKYGTYELAEIINCDISNIHLVAKKNEIPLPPRPKSHQEQRLINLFKDNNIKFINNSRNIITPYEIDFYLPDHNIAFEFNGLYWHSEQFKDKNYHYNKWKMCQEKGIMLYSIFEDNFSDLWENKILHLCNVSNYDRIYARKCIIKEVDGKTTKRFLDDSHLQGNVYSSINIGLYYKDELVSLMTFSNTRNNKKRTIELIRFCNQNSTQVVGAASKLLTYFLKTYSSEYDEIISFSDNTYSDGGLYETLGFELSSKLKPDYKYVFKNKRFHKSNFRKSEIQKKFNLDPEFVNNHTEKELMNMLGIYRIWDCGKKKWTLKINKEYK